MPPEETAVKSPLDKPLHLLTDDDISQLTREDCRRYLKQKGMRRPSWNKSQAIQQVISLKKLLETTPDSETGRYNKKLYSSPPDNKTINNPHRVPERANVRVTETETATLKEKDSENFNRSGNFTDRIEAVASESAPPRTIDSPNMPAGQMTIFYCGKVNVYDDMPNDKARAIMHLAAQDGPFDGTMTVRSPACQVQGTGVRAGIVPDVVHLPTPQPVEGPGSRKASVQRYLEKRKDRFKSKRRIGDYCPQEC